MAQSHIDIVKMKGLYLQQNSFTVPDGALEEALNVVVSQDDTIKRRRGFFSLNTPSATANSLHFYGNSLLHVMVSKVARINVTTGAETALSGVTVSTSGLTSRSVQANGNFYFTTNNGVLKLESVSSSVYSSGIPPALDLTGTLTATAGGPINDGPNHTEGNVVGYRVLFGKRDGNKNLLLGAPSDILALTNAPGAGDADANLEFSIPSEITSTDFFYQIYRTTQSGDQDVLPPTNFRLVIEKNITSTDLTNKYVTYTDDLDDAFLGAELYTNPNRGEGELQANTRAPIAKDMTVFKGYVFYANTTSRHALNLNLINTNATTGLQDGNTVTIAGRTYRAKNTPTLSTDFKLTDDSTSVAFGIDQTARSLVKTINRDTSATVYARYVSGFDDVPGKIFLQAKGFGSAFTATASSTQAGQAFSPELPTSGSTVSSDNDVQPNAIFISKLGEPEAVPLVNVFSVGEKNAAILRIEALRDSVIILKEDGVYRLNGDDVNNFSITILDNTVRCIAENSVAVLNNQVYALTTQGIVQISDTSASIESRAIELVISAVLGNSQINAQTAAVAYESERIYLLTTIAPNTNTAGVTYCYNYVTREWSQWDTYLTNGILGPSDTLFYIGLNGDVYKERKNQSKIDYCDEDFAFTVASVSSDKLTVVFAANSAVPQRGDIFVKDNFINRVNTVSTVAGVSTCTFQRTVNMLASDSVTLYSSYPFRVRYAPIHGGSPTRNKHYATFQAVFRNKSCTRAVIYFASEKFGGSESVEWSSANQSQIGWGMEPFGIFPWGDDETVNLEYTTGPNIHLRTYIPRFAARGTYLQPTLEHNEAGEAVVLQAVGISLRGYGERTVK